MKQHVTQVLKLEGTPVPPKEELKRLFDLWANKHPLHSHPYLDNIFDPRNDDVAARNRFAEVLYRFCECFHDCCLAIAANTHDEDIRRALVVNLYDEYGQGVKERGHLFLMRRLMHSLGYTDADLDGIHLNPGAQDFMDEILRYCREEDTLKAVGCICIGAECNGSLYFRKMHDAFKQKPSLSNADLYILEIHAGDDIEHREHMFALVEPYLDSAESRRSIHEGFLASINLFQDLWTSMGYYEDSPEVVVHGLS